MIRRMHESNTDHKVRLAEAFLNRAKVAYREGFEGATKANLNRSINTINSVVEGQDDDDISENVRSILNQANILASKVGLDLYEDDENDDDENYGNDDDDNVDSLPEGSEEIMEGLAPNDKKVFLKLIEATKHYATAKRFIEAENPEGAAPALDQATASVADAASVPGVSEELKANIENVSSAVESLKASAGISDQPDQQGMEGNADASLPPTEGVDQTQAPAMNESVETIAQRIRERKAKQAKKEDVAGKQPTDTKAKVDKKETGDHKEDGKMKEDFKIESTKTMYDAILKAAGVAGNEDLKFDSNKTDDKEEVNVPGKNTIKNGSDSEKIKWPNKEIPASIANGAIPTTEYSRKRHVKESEDEAIDSYLGKNQFHFKELQNYGIMLK
jgi:hypothetical protein